MRCFIAVPLPEVVLQKIFNLQQDLKKELDPYVRWTKLESIHLTLKFLGEIPEKQVFALIKPIQFAVTNQKKFTMKVSGLGVFPHINSPKVLWLGINPNNELIKLQNNLEENLYTAGFERDQRKFSPHLTLGRVINSIPTEKLQFLKSVIMKLDDQNGPVFMVENVNLIKSDLKHYVREYSILSKFLLGE
jgi:RNA 2',3'-cyclic 3'-phosphodiesterase